jgi:hypothetical protein
MNKNPIIKALQDELVKERNKLIKVKYPKPSVHNTTIHAANAIAKSDRQAFKLGHEAATARLLGLLEKAVEMAEFYSDENKWTEGMNYWEDFQITPCGDDLGKKAREFLAELEKEMK